MKIETKSYYTVDGEREDLGDFLAANIEGLSDEELRAVLSLAVGEFCVIGGGAAPLVQIQRWAEDTNDDDGRLTEAQGMAINDSYQTNEHNPEPRA